VAPAGPVGPTSAQVRPISVPAVQSEVEVTMRTAPVEVLTHAATVVDVGAAMAAVPSNSEEARTPRHLREDIESSGESW
jgi:hypothetical protein